MTIYVKPKNVKCHFILVSRFFNLSSDGKGGGSGSKVKTPEIEKIAIGSRVD